MIENERRILKALSSRGLLSPSQIADACKLVGGSGMDCCCLQGLCDQGLVCREPPGKYSITDKGIEALPKPDEENP